MSMAISGMSDTTKMMLFLFLGLVIAILVLGFSRSPKSSPQLGAQPPRTFGSVPFPLSSQKEELYPSGKRPY